MSRPASKAPVVYDREAYSVDRLLGKRRTTGAKIIKRVKPLHRQIMALHLQGYSNNTVADLLDCSAQLVSQVLNDPTIMGILQDHYDSADQELRALSSLAVASVRNALQKGTVTEQLNAADKVFKIHGKYKEEEKSRESLEDVVKRALEVAKSSVDGIREVSRSTPVNIIEGRSKEVKHGSD